MNRLGIVLITIFLIVGCEQRDTKTNQNAEVSNTIEITNGWVRPGNQGMMTAAYFAITNNTASTDSLIGISSTIAEDTQIHESFEMEAGMMGMREIDAISIESNSVVELTPGGLHVMVIRPFENILEGDSVTFSLEFLSTGLVEVTLPVQLSSAN